MNLFSSLTTDGLEESQDRLGGNQPLSSDIYQATIKAVYITHSQSGAMAANLIADIEGREYRETFYITNKEGKNYYLNQQNKKCPLPGFTVINDMCLIGAEAPLSDLNAEDKVLKLYDFESKSEVNKSVPVITDLIGKKVALGIVQRLENKNVKEGDRYVPSAETRTFNAVDKVFHPTEKLTVAEALHGKEPKFWDAWLKRNKNQVQDRRKIKEGQNAPKHAAPVTQQPKKSLFGAR